MTDSRTDELALLHEAAGLLAQTLDLSLIYSIFQSMITRAMDCDVLLVSLYTPEDKLMHCAFAYADGQELNPALYPPVSAGKPLIIADTRLDNEATSGTFIPINFPMQSLMIVPIQYVGQILGAVQIMSSRLHAYTEDHLRLLEVLLIQVAAATHSTYLFQKMSAEMAVLSQIESENARLLAEVQGNALRQRTFLRDVLASVTDGRLQLCDTPADLPLSLAHHSAPVPLSPTSGLGKLRHEAMDAAAAVSLSEACGFDLALAVGEAGMNAVVHAGAGTGQVFWDKEQQIVHVRIEDHGEGIPVENLPLATLKRGYSTKATLGHGMKMILQTTRCLWLLTGPTGTIVILEQGPILPDAIDAFGWV